MSLLADLTIETLAADGATWIRALHLTNVTISAPATARHLGEQALEAARMYHSATPGVRAVRARLEHGLRSATSYAGPLNVSELPPEQYGLLLNLYARGAIILADGDRVAETLIGHGLAARGLRVHGAVRGRQYVPAGPFTLQWHAYMPSEMTGDGWSPIGNGSLSVPADSQEMLDLVVEVLARYRAGLVNGPVRVVATIAGTTLAAFEDFDPARQFEAGRTVADHPFSVTVR